MVSTQGKVFQLFSDGEQSQQNVRINITE